MRGSERLGSTVRLESGIVYYKRWCFHRASWSSSSSFRESAVVEGPSCVKASGKTHLLKMRNFCTMPSLPSTDHHDEEDGDGSAAAATPAVNIDISMSMVPLDVRNIYLFILYCMYLHISIEWVRATTTERN